MASQHYFQTFRGGLRLALALALGLGLAVLFLNQAGAKPLERAAVQTEPFAPVFQEGGGAGDPDNVPDPAWLKLVESLSQPAGESPAGMTLDVNLGDAAIYGRVPSLTAVSLLVEREGIRIAAGEVLPAPNAGSFFYTAYLEWDYSVCYVSFYEGCAFLAGDILLASQAGNAISMTIPALTALAYPDADLISGVSQPGAALTIYGFSSAQPAVIYTQTVTSGPAGTYQADFSAIYDLRPADQGYVVDEIDAVKHAYILFVAPQLIVEVSGTIIQGVTAPDSSGMLTITGSGGQVVWRDYFYTERTGDYRYYYSLYPPYRNRIQAGQIVELDVGGQVFSTTVQTLTVSADLQQGQVHGKTQPDRQVAVFVVSGPLTSNSGYWFDQFRDQGVATATGTGDFNLSLLLQTADYGFAFVTTPKGHQTFARFVVPSLNVKLGRSGEDYSGDLILSGQVNSFAGDVIVSVIGPSGYLKDRFRLQSGPNGYLEDLDPFAHTGLTLESGDELQLQTTTGAPIISLRLPTLTAVGDAVNDIISGLAPPGTRITVEAISGYDDPLFPYGISGYPPYPSVVVTATAQGTYLADFSDIVNLLSETQVSAKMVTADGHRIQRIAFVQGDCSGVINRVQVGMNHLVLSACPEFTLIVRDLNGHLKYEQRFLNGVFWLSGIDLYDQQGYPVLLQSGDSIAVVGSSGTSQVIVPPLDVHLTSGTNQLDGHAPPGSRLTFSYWGIYFYTNFTATASQQGSFQVSVPGVAHFDPGSHATVSMVDGGLEAYSSGVLKGLDVQLYGDIGGWLDPFEPFILTWTEAQSGTKTVYTSTANWQGDINLSFEYLISQHVQPGDDLQIASPQTTIDLIVPALTVQLDPGSAGVSGTAPPGARLRVEMDSVEGYTYYEEVIATSSGTYSATYPQFAGEPGLRGEVSLLDISGNQVRLAYGLPAWQVLLGDTCVSVFAYTVGLPASLTRHPAGGGAPESLPVKNYYGFGLFTVCFSEPINTGDELVLTGPLGIMRFTVPIFNAQYDGFIKAIEGIAPPNLDLTVNLLTPYGPVHRHTLSVGDGHYGIDVSDLVLIPMSWGSIECIDAQGNTLKVYFHQGMLTFMPLVVLSGP